MWQSLRAWVDCLFEVQVRAGGMPCAAQIWAMARVAPTNFLTGYKQELCQQVRHVYDLPEVRMVAEYGFMLDEMCPADLGKFLEVAPLV